MERFSDKGYWPRRRSALVHLAAGQTLQLALASKYNNPPGKLKLVLFTMPGDEEIYMHKPGAGPTTEERLAKILNDPKPVVPQPLSPIRRALEPYRFDDSAATHRFGPGQQVRHLLLMPSLVERWPYGSHQPIPQDLAETYGVITTEQDPDLGGSPHIRITMPELDRESAPMRAAHEVMLRVVEGTHPFGIPDEA